MSEHSREPDPAPMPEIVERWELAGGTWIVASASPVAAVVELLRCDGGEVAETLTLSDPEDLRWAACRLDHLG